MKNPYFIFLILSLFTVKSFAQNGTFFEKISLGEALQKSLSKNNYIFVDCYTSWCGPCKKMSAQIFPQEKVGNYFNSKFVNVAFDIEKDEDGKMLAKKYNIRSVPTFLILNSDGTLFSKVVGASIDGDTFVKKVEESFDFEKMRAAIRKIYDDSNPKKAYLLDALNQFNSIGDSAKLDVASRLAKESSDKEKVSPSYWFIYSIQRFSPEGSENEAYLLNHYERFRKQVGKELVDQQLGERYVRMLKKIAEGKKNVPPQELRIIGLKINKLQLSKDYKLSQYILLAEAVVSKNIDSIIQTSQRTLPELNLNLYFVLSDKILKEGTVEQNKSWIRLGEMLLDNAPKDDMTAWTNSLIEHLKKKVKEREGA